MRKGFTLIELIVVIAIIAVLAAIIAPNAFKAIEKANVAKIIAAVNTFKTMASAYYADTGRYATEYCVEVYSVDTYPQYHQLSIDSGVFGWDGPYIESPLSSKTSPFKNGIIYMYAGLTLGFGSYQPDGFDFDGDGTVDREGSGNFLALSTAPEALSQRVDEKIDGDMPGDWTTTGRVEYQYYIAPTVNEAIMVYLTGGY